MEQCLPLVYHPDYNITLAGLERLHPFDSRKYGRVVQGLVDLGLLTDADQQLVTPAPPDEAFFAAHMDADYLAGLASSKNVAAYAEMPPVAFLPSFVVRRTLLRPMQLATAGTVEAARLALDRGCAVNIGGGYHHASLGAGGGFCVYPDITMAVRVARAEAGIARAMVIDLDAHQGNGHERDLGQDPDVYILDMYNHDIYPHDDDAARGIDLDVSAPSGITSGPYLERLGQALEQAFAAFAPQLVIYNAGTDVLSGDPLGCMELSEEAVVRRDEAVFAAALERQIPLMMVLSGGYQRSNAGVIARSLQNLFSTFELDRER